MELLFVCFNWLLVKLLPCSLVVLIRVELVFLSLLACLFNEWATTGGGRRVIGCWAEWG